MSRSQPIESSPPGRRFSRGANGLLRIAASLLALFSVLLSADHGNCGAEPSLSEYQVKALFLFNFAKYIDWPSTAFPDTNSPIVIGIVGENNFGSHLRKTVEGRSISGRGIVIRENVKEEDFDKCHILFISASERKHIGEVCNRVKAAPVLTVGETEQFTQQGGVIGFIKKEGKVRLQIDLGAARKASLQISSKLLSVADSVSSKP